MTLALVLAAMKRYFEERGQNMIPFIHERDVLIWPYIHDSGKVLGWYSVAATFATYTSETDLLTI